MANLSVFFAKPLAAGSKMRLRCWMVLSGRTNADPSDAVDCKPAIDDQLGAGDVLGLIGRKE